MKVAMEQRAGAELRWRLDCVELRVKPRERLHVAREPPRLSLKVAQHRLPVDSVEHEPVRADLVHTRHGIAALPARAPSLPLRAWDSQGDGAVAGPFRCRGR